MGEILDQKRIEALKQEYVNLKTKELREIITDKNQRYGLYEHTAAQILFDGIVARSRKSDDGKFFYEEDSIY